MQLSAKRCCKGQLSAVTMMWSDSSDNTMAVIYCHMSALTILWAASCGRGQLSAINCGNTVGCQTGRVSCQISAGVCELSDVAILYELEKLCINST